MIDKVFYLLDTGSSSRFFLPHHDYLSYFLTRKDYEEVHRLLRSVDPVFFEVLVQRKQLPSLAQFLLQQPGLKAGEVCTRFLSLVRKRSPKRVVQAAQEAMFQAQCKLGQSEAARETWSRMHRSGVRVTDNILVSRMELAARQGNLSTALDLLRQHLERSKEPAREVWSVMYALEESGNVGALKRFLPLLRVERLQFYHPLVSLYLRRGEMQKVRKIYEDMEDKDTPLRHLKVLLSMMRLYAEEGLEERALSLVERIAQVPIAGQQEWFDTASQVLQVCGRLSREDAAVEFLNRSPHNATFPLLDYLSRGLRTDSRSSPHQASLRLVQACARSYTKQNTFTLIMLLTLSRVTLSTSPSDFPKVIEVANLLHGEVLASERGLGNGWGGDEQRSDLAKVVATAIQYLKSEASHERCMAAMTSSGFPLIVQGYIGYIMGKMSGDSPQHSTRCMEMVEEAAREASTSLEKEILIEMRAERGDLDKTVLQLQQLAAECEPSRLCLHRLINANWSLPQLQHCELALKKHVHSIATALADRYLALDCVEDAERILHDHLTGAAGTAPVIGRLAQRYAEQGLVGKVEELFHTQPNPHLASILLRGYSSADMTDRARVFMNKVLRDEEGLGEYNSTAFASLAVDLAGRFGDVSEVEQIIQLAGEKLVSHGNVTCSIVEAYCRQGRLDKGLATLLEYFGDNSTLGGAEEGAPWEEGEEAGNTVSGDGDGDGDGSVLEMEFKMLSTFISFYSSKQSKVPLSPQLLQSLFQVARAHPLTAQIRAHVEGLDDYKNKDLILAALEKENGVPRETQ